MAVIVRSTSGEVAGFEEAGVVAPIVNPSGDQLDQWLKYGVPGLRGRVSGDMVIDEEVIIKPDNPLFGLALLEHFEEIGWTTLEESWTSNQSIENVFCPTGEGGGVDPSCSPGGGGTARETGIAKKVKSIEEPFFMSSQAGNVEANKNAVEEMKALALAGKIADLKAHPGTLSPKVQKYKDDLVKGLQEYVKEEATKLGMIPSAEPATASMPAGSQDLPDPSSLTFVKALPGSTNPKLMEDKDGKQYVVKTKTSNVGHVVNEALSDELYRKLGVDVPDSKIVANPDNSVSKVSEFLKGETYAEFGKSETYKDVVREEASKNFVADALMANWDVAGLSNDNLMVSGDKVYRIDNGGALRYRAQGALKEGFDGQVKELDTLRNPSMNPNTADLFKNVTEKDIQDQIKGILPKRDEFLKAIPDQGLRNIMASRFDYLKERLDKSQQTPSTTTKAEPIPKVVKVEEVKSISGKAVPTKEVVSKAGFTPIAQSIANEIVAKDPTIFSKGQLDKLKLLNPNGVENNKLNVVFSYPASKKAIQLEKLAKAYPGVKFEHVYEKKFAGFKEAVIKQKGYAGKQEFELTKGQGPSSVKTGSSVSIHSKQSVPSSLDKAMDQWKKTLSPAERQSISTWKGGSQKAIKMAIASGDAGHAYADKAKQFMSALEKAPIHAGTLYRGMKSNKWVDQEMENIKLNGVGSTWTDNTPHGFSLDGSTSQGFSGGHLLLQAKTKTSKAIINEGGFEHEKEVIGLPNTKYRVTNIVENAKVNGNTVKLFVELEEI
mgnify:CR=1 FL=1